MSAVSLVVEPTAPCELKSGRFASNLETMMILGCFFSVGFSVLILLAESVAIALTEPET